MARGRQGGLCRSRLDQPLCENHRPLLLLLQRVGRVLLVLQQQPGPLNPRPNAPIGLVGSDWRRTDPSSSDSSSDGAASRSPWYATARSIIAPRGLTARSADRSHVKRYSRAGTCAPPREPSPSRAPSRSKQPPPSGR